MAFGSFYRKALYPFMCQQVVFKVQLKVLTLLTHLICFLYKFCLNLLDGGIHKDRASGKQSLLS